jgi:hypothetical protein
MLPYTSWKNILPARWRQRLVHLRDLANRHPRRSAAILLTTLALQAALVFFWQPSVSATSLDYTQLRAAVPISPSGARPGMPPIPFTIGNYREVRALLDTLEYLRSRPGHSRSDTLLFLRIMERYARLDTAFARSLRSADRSLPSDPHPSTHQP